MTTAKTQYLVGHVSPDLDCIGALWLLQHFGGFSLADIELVSFADVPAALLASAAAVVDIGGEHDPVRWRFDHHQDPNLPSAITLVYRSLRARDMAPAYLFPLVDLIDDGDRWGPVSASSRQLGIHAVFTDYKNQTPRPSNQAILAFGFDLLSRIARYLHTEDQARQQVHTALRWQSDDGLVVAIENGDRSVTDAAGEVLGAGLVVWWQRTTQGSEESYSVGCKRVGRGAAVHVGQVVEVAENVAYGSGMPEMAAELNSWFKHPQGWVAMRGTAKAPRYDAPEVDVVSLAQMISGAWTR